MTLKDFLLEKPVLGKELSSPTNDEYRRLCATELHPRIAEILKDNAEAVRNASNYYIR
ncbi:MAG: hypothetical protein HQL05_04715 [Nitrospirae bacterium]|uniref:hypothetical protein n=1 Tax=Candidatus Magnetobacterium casense TaxID=1455061 RepID=UPI0012DC25D5|nr:hypothetical protein [Candidatus Magnetobacterium casensis]MBF0337115.1 hypothetical protein [Nitrospirota bacterium]